MTQSAAHLRANAHVYVQTEKCLQDIGVGFTCVHVEANRFQRAGRASGDRGEGILTSSFRTGDLSSLGLELMQHINIRWWPLWSSGQSSWLQIQRLRFDSRCYQIF
jgi:hypothetical protein